MENNIDVFKLKSIDADTHPEKELRELVRHLQDQMNNTYVYWIGEWAGSRRSRSTRNGEFVSREDVISYLNGK